MSDDSESTCATAPFDHAKANVILRSSDNIDFRVFKLFLSVASPVFETLFNIPQPAEASEDQEVKDGLAVISLSEDSKTLDALLRFCYPPTLADSPNLGILQDAVDVFDAARKYSLDAIERKACQAIVDPKFLEAEPLRCFAIVHQRKLREETLLAAKYTLTQPLIPSWFQGIELISASDLLSLLTYHRRCGEAVYALKNDLSWIRSHYGSSEACSWLAGRHLYSGKYCECSWSDVAKYALFGCYSLQWWEEFMKETFTELQDKPCERTVQTFAKKTEQAVRARQCSACSPAITEGMRDLSDLFVRKVEETISRVELELSF